MKTAIRVENLSKRYRIGLKEDVHENLFGAIGAFIKSPLKNFRKYQSLYAFKDRDGDGQSEGVLWALRDISFDVKEGETIGIIGKNGAGKSTLLKVLSRITHPTAGRVEIRGRVSSLLEVGTGFHQELSGRENIYLNGTILGMRKFEIDRKFDEIVAFSGVEKFLDTPVKRYSSGMRVRLAFSVAAHLEPDVLIIDEVLAVGDAAFQNKCLGKMSEVAQQGRTVIFVSHNMAAVENLCSRSILIDEGQVVEIDDTGTVIDTYLKTVSDLAQIPLARREDRKGKGDIVIEDVTFLDSQNKPIDFAFSGADLKIQMHYRCKTDEPVPNCRFSATIRRKERIYSMLSTELVSRSQIDVQGEGIIEFVVPKFPLTESVYYITVFIESNKVILDWVMDAIELNVIDGDYYGTGRNYPNKHFKGEYTLMDFAWNHYPVDEIASVQPAATSKTGS